MRADSVILDSREGLDGDAQGDRERCAVTAGTNDTSFSTSHYEADTSSWTPLEKDLWAATRGLFIPAPRGAGTLEHDKTYAAKARFFPGAVAYRPLVSVICPTISSRRSFHSFLWACFDSQTYKPVELVVVETGEGGPSEFFLEKQRVDARLVYRHFSVKEDAWSIGLKRNIACYFASGEVISHFDDDDMYGSCYLEDMVSYMVSPFEAFRSRTLLIEQNPKLGEKMLEGMKITGRQIADLRVLQDALRFAQLRAKLGKFGAACAKLCCWHEYILGSGEWRVVNMLEEDDAKLYGWGFTLCYLRSAWEAAPFPHIGIGEDYAFVQAMRDRGAPLIFVHDVKGICAHTQHADNTTGGDPRGETPPGHQARLFMPVGPLVSMYAEAARDILVAQKEFEGRKLWQ